jgi:hypothetical protein
MQMTTQQLNAAAEQGRDLAEMIDAIELPELNKRYLKARWLDQVLWAEGRAKTSRDRHYLLRVISIVGGVIVPALVGLDVQGDMRSLVGISTFTFSLIVAVCLALENFFRWGERWTHYRRLSELLKSEGWLYLELGGGYQDAGSHARAYPEFVKRIEALLGADVDAFIAQVVQSKPKPEDTAGSGGKS